jgi:hypothetical protein
MKRKEEDGMRKKKTPSAAKSLLARFDLPKKGKKEVETKEAREEKRQGDL